MLDLKTNQMEENDLVAGGKNLFNIVYENLFDSLKSQTKIKVLLAVELTKHKKLITSFIREAKNKDINFGNKVGWQISNNEYLEDIDKMWRQIKVVKRIWYSDGARNCKSADRQEDRLKKITNRRDNCDLDVNQYCPRKINLWTIDRKFNMRKTLRLNVDAIVTNLPKDMNEVLDEEEFRNAFRLATTNDNPWIIYKP
ncbi:sphingomyelinase D-like protein [Leptotrombidium deliense]|uniref:Sphingomyelinase D-like protein n=1 Tax=Leptotrombidium deliense TaxID=299467 RepID=A0A443SE72_9ACAR|nr:sphingomyelinase D-like protein [Leptotrombidium deliense]